MTDDETVYLVDAVAERVTTIRELRRLYDSAYHATQRDRLAVTLDPLRERLRVKRSDFAKWYSNYRGKKGGE